jgi:predicted membrane protein
MVLLALLLIVAGALAIPTLIAKKQPNAGEALAKLVPFQGIIGVVLLLWGLVMLFTDVLAGGLTLLNAISPLWGILYLLTDLVSIGLGALLGYGLIAKYALSNSPDAARSGEAVRAKLAGIQVPLGIAGIALGIFLLILRYIILPAYIRSIGLGGF